MEILKNFVFDLQRHAGALANASATITTDTEITGPSTDGVYYYEVIDGTPDRISGSYTTSPAANTSYLRVELTGTTYTLSTYTTGASAGAVVATSAITFNAEKLKFNSSIQDATLVTATSGNKVVLGGDIYASVPAGGSIKVTAGGATIRATENSQFIVKKDGSAATVYSGSAYLNYNGSLAAMSARAGGEVVTAAAGSSVVLSYDGKVSSLDAGDEFRTADANSSGVTYTVDSIGGSVALTNTFTGYADSTKEILINSASLR